MWTCTPLPPPVWGCNAAMRPNLQKNLQISWFRSRATFCQERWTVNNKYNAGYIAETFTKSWGSDIKIIEESNEKFKEVEVLNLNSQKAKDRLNWIPKLEIDDLLNLIVRWEKNHFEEKNQEFSFDEISSYLKLIK